MSKTTPKLSEVAKKYGFKDEKAIYGTWNGYSICIDNFADEDDPPRISASVSRAGQKPTKDVVDSALSNAEHLGYVRIKGWMISVNLPDSVKVIARDFVLILDELTRSLSAAGLQNCDSKTGKVGPTQFYRINGRLTILSEESFQREIQAAAERRERYEHTKERYPLGICGALLASIAAGMLYILLCARIFLHAADRKLGAEPPRSLPERAGRHQGGANLRVRLPRRPGHLRNSPDL